MKNNNLYRILGAVFTLLLIVTFTGCGDDDNNGDTIAPTWTSAPVINCVDSGDGWYFNGTIVLTTDENATIYYYASIAASGTFNSEETKAHAAYTLAATAGSPTTLEFTSIIKSSYFDIVAEDESGNLQATPTVLQVLAP